MWALIRGWPLIYFFYQQGGRIFELGAYILFLSTEWAHIRGGRLFEVGCLIE